MGSVWAQRKPRSSATSPPRTRGAAPAGAKEHRGIPSPADLPTNPSVGVRPSWSSNTDATAAATANGCGVKICPEAAPERQKISRTGLAWALNGLVCQHLSVSRIAEGLGVTWNTANDAVLAEGQRLLIDDPARFSGVKVLGVDEHVWRHTRTGDKYVTVIVDLTAVRDGTGTARLLDMVPGRSKAVFKTWLAGQDDQWKQGIDVVAMDGFTGFKTAAAEELPHAVEVLDPFHVVKLGSEALDETRQRVQREQHGRRGRKDDPLYKCRRTLTTGLSLATDKQKAKLEDLFTAPEYEPVQLVWSVYQKMVDAYRQPKPEIGRWALEQLINGVGSKIPKGMPELKKLGGTLRRRKTDILAYFDHVGSSNGPTEALNGRLEHLRGIALGFKNLTHYIARSLLETGGFRPWLHSQS